MDNKALNMAAVIASNSFYVGGDWGFVLNSNEDYETIFNMLKSDSNVKVIEVYNGIIVFCNPQYTLSAISQVEEVSAEDKERQQTRLQTETLEFQKFLTDILRDKCKYGVAYDTYKEYNIGIYSCNSTHKIRLNGVEYPAFSLTLKEVFKEIKKLQDRLSVYINTYDGFLKMSDINTSEMFISMLEGLEISNTLTGAFLTIRISK